MKKILIILLFMCSAAFADYTFYVENSTMVDAYFNVFNAIGALFQNNEYVDLLRFAFLIGGFFVFAEGVFKAWEGNASSTTLFPYAKYLAVGVALLTIVFSYKDTLWVTTNNIPSYCSSSSATTGFAVEIPSTLAFVFATTNKVGRGLTELAESAYSDASGTGNSTMLEGGGYLGSLKQTINLLSINPDSVNFKSAAITEKTNFMSLWQRFFTSCVFEVANNQGLRGEQKVTEMLASKDIYTYIKGGTIDGDAVTSYLEYIYDVMPIKNYDIGINGTTTTCGNYFQILEDTTTEFMNNFNCAMPLANGGVLELITGSSVGTGSDLAGIARQSGIIQALATSKANTSIGISGGDYASGKTRAEAAQQNIGGAHYMAQMLPYVQMTMRAILYAFFPFVFVVVLLPGGIRVLTQYMQTLIWIELWMPTAAVVNMFVNLQVKNDVGEQYSSVGLNYISSVDMLSEANTIAGVGAMLYLTVPALTWLILKGSGHMLGNVTGGIAAKFSQNLNSDSIKKDLSEQKHIDKVNRERIAQGQKALSYGEAMHYETNMSSSKTSGELIAQMNNGSSAVQSSVKQKVGADLVEAALKKSTAGSDENVSKIEGQMANKHFVEKKEINEKTTTSDFKAKGTTTSSEMKANTEVLDKKGANSFYDAKVQNLSTTLDAAAKKKVVAGGNQAVADVESDMSNKDFIKKSEINDKTTEKDFANMGKKDAADIQATSNVVEKEGVQGFKDSKEQALLSESKTAKEKKAISGSNEKVAKTAADKNIAGFKTDKKTFDTYSTDTVSTSDFEKRKEDITKTLETKKSIENNGYSDTKDFYANEAKMLTEERNAAVAKADLNNDKKVDVKEQKEYGSDMTKKAVSDQNSLKFKNRRLAENADKYANSENKDVRDTYNAAKAKYAHLGEEEAKVAAAAAVQTSISTKEQRFNSDEKSEYVDQMENNGISGVAKADAQVQKEAEDIRKTNSETESYVDVSKEQNKAEKYFNTKENFKDKGMSELEAQNATLFAYAKEGKSNSHYSEHVFNNNTKDIIKNRDKEMLDAAKESGAVKGGMKGVSTVQDAKNISKLEKRKEQIETTLKAFDKFRNDRGQLTPERQMNAQPLILERDKLNKRIENAKGYAEFRKSEAGQAIAMKAVKKLDNLVENMKTMNLAKEDANGNLMFSSSSNIDKDNLTMSQRISLRKEKGDSDGRGISGVGQDGRRYEVVTDISNTKITDFTSAKNGYSNTGSYNNDILYNVGQTDIGRDNAKAIATGVTGVNTVKGAIGTVGAGKFITNLFK